MMMRALKYAFLALLCASVAGCSADSQEDSGVPRDVGLVLSSGGCKGAYHLGVWRALSEAGLVERIGAISGTSAGALCAALLVSVRDRTEQEKVWQDTFSIFRLSPDRADVERIYAREEKKKLKWYDVAELSPKMKEKLWEEAEKEARHDLMPKIAKACRELEANMDTTELTFGAMSMEPLRRNLDAVLPNPFTSAHPVIYASALKCGKDREFRSFRINSLDHKTQIDALCASASIPIAFPPVEIDGALWQDGGWVERGGDRTPVDPILKNHKKIKIVIVVYLQEAKEIPVEYRTGLRRKAESAGVRLVEIVPSRRIGGPFKGWFGVFDTTEDTMQELIEVGYSDAKKTISSAFPSEPR